MPGISEAAAGGVMSGGGTRWAGPLLFVPLLMAAAPVAWAVETRSIRDVSGAHFSQGETTGVEVLATGRLQLAPSLGRRERTSEALTWSIASHPSTSTLYFSTGNSGKVFRLEAGGPAEVHVDLEESQALSLALDPLGGLFVGAAPSGKIYRVTGGGSPEVFFETGEKYVWSLAVEETGAVIAATGPNGRIFRVWGAGNGGEIFKGDQTNIMSVSIAPDGRILAGTQGKAAVARIDSSDRGYVLWSGNEDEVRAVVQAPDSGVIYAAINSARAGAMADAPPGTEAPGGTGGPAPGAGDRRGDSQPGGPASGPSGSSVLRILPAGFASTLWNAPEGPIHSMVLLPGDGSLAVAAGRKGRVWRVAADGSASIIADSDQGLVTALATHDASLLLGTANRAGIEVLETTGVRTGIFQSRPLNAAATVRWGNIHLDSDPAGGTGITLLVRTGNTPEPSDRTWSAFSTATLVASPLPGQAIYSGGSPVAQYLQYRLILATNGAAPESPVVDGIQAFFLPPNAPPVIRDIEFLRGGDLAQFGQPGQPGAPPTARSPQSTAVTGRPSAGLGLPGSASANPEAIAMAIGRLGGGPRGGPGAPESSAPADRPGGANVAVSDNSRRVVATWDAADPNGDRLRFRVRIKAEDETQWRLLEDDISNNVLLLATDTLPDGRYRLEVAANDADSNPADEALSATLVSRILTVDNTPPVIGELRGELLPDGSLRITGAASDALSPLAAGDYMADASREPRMFLPHDGIFDSPTESFTITLRPEAARAEHVVTVRVYDREGNSTVGRALIKGNGAK